MADGSWIIISLYPELSEEGSLKGAFNVSQDKEGKVLCTHDAKISCKQTSLSRSFKKPAEKKTKDEGGKLGDPHRRNTQVGPEHLSQTLSSQQRLSFHGPCVEQF